MFAAWMFYWRASRPLGFGMLVVFVAMAWFTRWVYDTFGVWNLLYAAIAVFVVAWIAQFVGHSKLFEGRKPSFFTDLRYLLIGPARSEKRLVGNEGVSTCESRWWASP